jgi:hypothetical protein
MVHALFNNSHGTQPEVVVDDVFPEGIVAMDYAAEDRTLVIATGSGHLIKLSQSGEQLVRERGFSGVESLVWSDAGTLGAAAMANGQLVCFDSKLNSKWQVDVTANLLGLAVSPFGSHFAVSTELGRVHIVTSDRRELCSFETPQPLQHLQLLSESPLMIGAAEFGHLCCHDLKGKEQWNVRIMNNVGDMATSGDGERILLAAFNHGIQVLDGSGQREGSFMIDGVPNRIAAAQNGRRLAATTLENRLYWLGFDGNLLWAADMSADPVYCMAVSPLADRLFIATQSGRLLQLLW